MTQVTLQEAYHELLTTAMWGRGGFHLRRRESSGSAVLEADVAGDRIPLAAAGFRSKRWLMYVDDYLYGGPPFRQWLSGDHREVFVFGGTNDHTHGPCIKEVEVSDGRVLVTSRACELAPVGIVDLTLLWLMSSTLRLPVTWVIDSARLVDWQGIAYSELPSLAPLSPLGLAMTAYLNRVDVDNVKFARQARLVRSRGYVGSSDEALVVRDFCRINPNDLQVVYGVPRVRVQGFLKKTYGYSATGPGAVSYSWSSLEDPVLVSVAERFSLNLDKMHPIEGVIASRVRRGAR